MPDCRSADACGDVVGDQGIVAGGPRSRFFPAGRLWSRNGLSMGCAAMGEYSMRIPFAVWSGILALLVYGGFVGAEYLNFGIVDPLWPTAKLIGMVWLGLAVVVTALNALRRSLAPRSAALPDDVAREIRQHQD